ncbi:uncharacterized protein LOC107426727 isoform X2 [Ziziphus jujuba]|uniref:Uncharacterized protein LOC107426727 isoform X2 n=1 Tax=Ziziphus jujuba TaxID=326968 RepID=A0A6P4ATD5_ZIZJJ|nr:uncharacterized protein LOC107426727 isoform X2 [Ziziphus jujuba]
MGGDFLTPSEEESSLNHDFSLMDSPLLRDKLRMKIGGDPDEGESGLVFQEFDKESHQLSSASLDFETNQRRMNNIYAQIFWSFDELHVRSSNGLEEAKSKILSYTPGGWIEKVGNRDLGDYDVPNTTTLILIGPKGSGKSSLVNRISKVFEDDKFAPERAQVSYNSSLGDGTCFLQEYMVPRGSTSFCLYDTRSLSDNLHDNIKMLKRWMTNGVRNGELVIRDSDIPTLRAIMKCKARNNGSVSKEIRKVNFVIFVVNALSILKSMDSDGSAEKEYTKLIASTFKCPYLSFRDDKPVIVVTHGDLLSRFDRARVQVHLGELLGIPPTKQIFDIPESDDPITKLTIIDMLRYSLVHADKNLPQKQLLMKKVHVPSLSSYIFLAMILGIAIAAILISAHIGKGHGPQPKPHVGKKPAVQWHKIRHMWLE